MIELIYAVCIVLLIVGTLTDLKTREVPDWLNYSGIFAGLGLRLMWSVYSFEWHYILEGLLGFGVFFGIAVAMFYLGQWGGGDSKLLMALGALLGLRFSLDSFTVGFIVNLAIFGGIYGIIWSAALAFKNWKKFRKQFRKSLDKYTKIRAVSLGFAFGSLVFAFFIGETFTRLLLVFVALFVPVMIYLILAVKSVENVCMYKKVSPSELTEGDWIADDVFVKGKKICGPKDLGIDKKQINKLIKFKIKKVLIKVGIPFVPSFLIAFLITLLVGNPLLFLV
ncbi:A24 family peptidase [Candidatus Woesearchaeota archaeon]|nr:A24 family peptidase [Candidatus Woesearchaeota archaeon]